ncbi:MAG: effector binding domain-containing protein [Clostridiales bacterium]|nr:effector binding domain-containing protein [Clostridiales bacterium]
MKLVTISNVSKQLDISTRTLRYYEKIGLIKSTTKPDYAYRVYDEETILKLQQIIILKKLNIRLKKIKEILLSNDAVTAISIFQEKLYEIDENVNALNTIKSIVEILVQKLQRSVDISLQEKILADDTIHELLKSIAPIKNNLKENKTMDELNKASEELSAVHNVRIVYLPPVTVASAHHIGNESEDVSGNRMKEFINTSNLCAIKPDFRLYGFNNPNPDESGNHGYEFWVTIPDDLEVDKPMKKKQFAGGLYAAHCIKMGNFHEWQDFGKWVMQSDEYEYDRREPLGMDGTIEEHLNAYSFYKDYNKSNEFIQLDLLIPVKKK